MKLSKLGNPGYSIVRWVSVRTDRGPRGCVVLNQSYIDVHAADPELPATVRGLIALDGEGRKRAIEAAESPRAVRYDPATVALESPIPDPAKIVCLGLNYRDHAAESGMPIPEEPVLFSKYATTLIGHNAEIVLPRSSSEVDYEAELVVVVGAGGRHIPKEQAYQHVAGYTIGHDVSARDWQLNKPGKQWMAGKTFDTFAPTGPELVSADEIPDPHDLAVSLRLNGKTMQSSNTSRMIFKIDEIIAYLSGIFTLETGDMIFTGTPPGVGMARKPPVWLQPGDLVEVEIERLGVLRNHVGRH